MKGQKTFRVKAEFLDAAIFWHRVEGVSSKGHPRRVPRTQPAYASGESGSRERKLLGSHRNSRHLGIEENLGRLREDWNMLVLSRKKNESIVINNDIKIVVVEIRGDKVRLGVEAPREVPVHRREVYDAIQRSVESGDAPVES